REPVELRQVLRIEPEPGEAIEHRARVDGHVAIAGGGGGTHDRRGAGRRSGGAARRGRGRRARGRARRGGGRIGRRRAGRGARPARGRGRGAEGDHEDEGGELHGHGPSIRNDG